MLSVKITKSAIEKSIEESPFYPSLLSLSSTYNRFRIENNALQITKENLTLVKPPFIALIDLPGNGKDFVVVTKIKEDIVFYSYKTGKVLQQSTAEFTKLFQDVIFLAESNNNSGDPQYKSVLKEENRKRIKLYLNAVCIFSMGV